MNASVNTFKGHPKLLDYTASKGAMVGFARSLSNAVVNERGIRVNGGSKLSHYLVTILISLVSRCTGTNLDTTHVRFFYHHQRTYSTTTYLLPLTELLPCLKNPKRTSGRTSQ